MNMIAIEKHRFATNLCNHRIEFSVHPYAKFLLSDERRVDRAAASKVSVTEPPDPRLRVQRLFVNHSAVVEVLQTNDLSPHRIVPTIKINFVSGRHGVGVQDLNVCQGNQASVCTMS